MSFIELLFALFALGPGALVLAIAWRRGWAFASVERPKVPVAPLLIAAGAILVGVGVGLALGFVLFEPLLALAFHGRELSMTSPTGLLVVRLRLGGAFAIGLAMPGAAAVAALLASRDRSARFAVALAFLVALGLFAGAALGAAVVPAAMDSLFADGMLVGIAEAAELMADAILGLGLAGATFTGSALAASRSAPAFRAALALGALAPGVALCVSGLLTPPDLITQLALTIVLGGAYAASLAVAGGVCAMRG